MINSQFSFRHREFVNRVASISIFGLAIMLAGCSGQGVSYGDLQSKRYQDHKAASAPIPSEPVYGYNDSETVSAVARYQHKGIESKTLAPVRVASLDNNYVGSTFAMQPVQASQPTGNAGSGGERYAQAGPGYYPQRGYQSSRPERYEDSDYERERVPARYDAERYLRKKDYRPEAYAQEDHGYYTVVSGDTVYSLAKRFGMSTAELAELNGIIGSKIFVGQRLRVNGKPVYTASSRYDRGEDEREDYGETAYDKPKHDPYEDRGGYDYDERKSPPPRARSYSSYEDYNARSSRPRSDYDRREEGYEEREEEEDRYRKSYEKPSGGYEKYTVRRGDTLSIIARHFRLDHRELAYYNDIPLSGPLYPGQVLRIPNERGEATDYDREEVDGEDEYSERKAPPRRHKPAQSDEDLPYWKRRAVSSPAGKADERRVASTGQGVSTPEVVVDDGEDRQVRDSRERERPSPSSQDEEPVIAAHSDVNAAGSKPKQAQASVGDCNDLLERPMPRSAKTFREPVEGLIVARFGAASDQTVNDGVDFSVPKGTPVKAAENGVVAYTGDELPGFGKLVLVRHADGYVTAYAHNDELLVSRCDVVKRGQVISRAGATGKVAKPQLHFEIRKDAKPVDPEAYFARS